jgi:shikimate dehydrogenase
VTVRLALIGHPVGHSRSPAMMAAAFGARGLDARYEALDTPPGALDRTLAALWDGGFAGANVTVPWKAAVRAAVRSIDHVAARCGAVNTLVRAADGFHGTNTDVVGFARAVRDAGAPLAGQRVVVLGAGGAARAVVAAAEDAGAAAVTVLARQVERACALGVAGAGFGTTAARAALADATMLVQTTPCGMTGGPPGEAIVAAAALAGCAPGACAVDLVYAPRETAWMRAARATGLRVLDDAGLGMLVHQGAAAFERWFGGDAPVAAMRAAARLDPSGGAT